MDVTFLEETALIDAEFFPWKEAASPAHELRRLLRLLVGDWPLRLGLLSPAVLADSSFSNINSSSLFEVPQGSLLAAALGVDLAELVLFRLGSFCYSVVEANRSRRLACIDDDTWDVDRESSWIREGADALQHLFSVRSQPAEGWAGDKQAVKLCESGFFSDAHVIASMHLAHLLHWQGRSEEATARVESYIEAVTRGPLRKVGWETSAAERLLIEIAAPAGASAV